MTRRDRLGKGLGALLGEYLGEERVSEVEVRELPVGAIAPNPYQPRRQFTEAELADLADSIRENGLLQPIVVRPAEREDAGWELVAGERRWRAVTRLGWPSIPAVVRPVDDRTLLVLALVENLQRAALSPLEEAEAYQQLADDFSLSHAQIAEVVGRDRSTVANSVRLLQLPASARRLVSDGALTAGHARALLALGSERRMVELGKRAADGGWSVRQLEQRVRRERGRAEPEEKAKKAGRRDAAERMLEEELQRVFGTAVRIRRSRGKKGRIEIPFYGAEDFERVFELLAGESAADLIS